MKTPGWYRVYRYPEREDRILRKRIEELRRLGCRGGYIRDHRALLTSKRGSAPASM